MFMKVQWYVSAKPKTQIVLDLPIAHVVKVLSELSQVWTLLLILLLGPKQHLRNLKNKTRIESVELSGRMGNNDKHKDATDLNFIEEFSIKKSELIGNLMTTEVMERSGPVRTRGITS